MNPKKGTGTLEANPGLFQSHLPMFSLLPVYQLKPHWKYSSISGEIVALAIQNVRIR
jgi:hypothetical protein